MKKWLICALVLAFGFPAVAAENPRQVVSASQVPSEGYFLLVGDELDIAVWGRDDLNRKVQIKDDGTFIFPLIGEIQAAGRSLKEVEREMLERLKASISSATVQKESSPFPETPRRVISAGDLQSETYHLRISDELDVTVWSHDALNRTKKKSGRQGHDSDRR